MEAERESGEDSDGGPRMKQIRMLKGSMRQHQMIASVCQMIMQELAEDKFQKAMLKWAAGTVLKRSFLLGAQCLCKAHWSRDAFARF